MARRACLLLASVIATLYGSSSEWDDIHFQKGSDVVVEGFDTLKRLAAVLNMPGCQARLTGNADSEGPAAINDKLALARARAVKEYLLRLRVGADRVIVSSDAERNPIADNHTKEGRFQNRRVSIQLSGCDGRIAAPGGADETTRALQEILKQRELAEAAILKRLDRLDDLLAANRDLKGELDRIKGQLAEMENRVSELRPPEISVPVTAAAPEAPSHRWQGRFSGRSFLLERDPEAKNYGLYSYLLIPRKPADKEVELKNRYLAALDAYIKIDRIEEFRDWTTPPPLSTLNITYLTVHYVPERLTSELLLGMPGRS
jgi:hypothetical protein